MQRFGWLVLAAAAVACGSGSGGSSAPSDLMPGFTPGPAPAAGAGFQIIVPPVYDIEAGGSYEYCTWTNVTLDHDVWIKSSQGWQTETGHHVIIFYNTNPQPAQTRICSDSDMANFRFATGAAGEGASELNTLPGNLAVFIPKGSQIVVNHHYLNASTTSVPEAQSALNVLYADPGSTIERASSLVFLDTAMSVPPGQNSINVTCTIKQPFETWYMIPHMHNWGQHITIDHIAGSKTDRLFDVDWDPSYAFHPPELKNDPTSPHVFNVGDQVHVRCDYNNTTGSPLTFGKEMCVFFAGTVDPKSVGNIACDSDTWGPF